MNFDKIIAVRNNKTVYRDGNRSIKVFNADYPKADILNEALNQARIEELGLNTPKLLEVSVIDGKWVIISEFIKGETLSELMNKNPEKKNEYIELLVDLQTEINSKTCLLLNNMKDVLNRKIAVSDLDATTRFDLHTKLEDMPKHNKVCHGDLSPANVVITEDKTPYVLDWSHTTQGNASCDAARTYLLFWLEGDIDGAEKYLELFCEKTETPKENVMRWMPYVAASQSVTGREFKREFLRSWVK